jgi:hypothetical protein
VIVRFGRWCVDIKVVGLGMIDWLGLVGLCWFVSLGGWFGW